MAKFVMTVLLSVAFSVAMIFVVGCESDAQTGALLGAGIGAGVGALAGGDTEGTLIGAAVGAGAGYILGNEGDKKDAAGNKAIGTQTDIVDVEVTNSNGSTIVVPLRRQGSGYVGPRGEYYDHMPTGKELKPTYGF